ncbi:hypothetical protein [Kutzneria chonburiensis]|uniref:DUF3037 domain-containing protein n=1 Tax=Kutzneria chonburiensis TaxID=1483604 RepID=A0ABV6N226_9PSEU|nr:hypothetical protein [Kutzneria chonburiensis]
MFADWYLVKYRTDVFRNEPKNIGVVVVGEDGGVARFIGEKDDGRFDRRSVQNVVASSDAFCAWIEYLRYHLDEGMFDKALSSLKRRTLDNYELEYRGQLLDLAFPQYDMRAAVDSLFNDLVSTSKGAQVAHLEDVVNDLLFKRFSPPLGTRIEKDVVYNVDLRGQRRSIKFDFRYLNSIQAGASVRLLEKVSLLGQDLAVERRVNDLLFRIEQVEHSVDANVRDFITLYDSRAIQNKKMDLHLKTIEKFSRTIDVSSARALEDVTEGLGVATLG